MKILHTVESYYPSIGGMQEVVKQLSERLARKGHQVTVATSYHNERKAFFHNDVLIKSFKIQGNLVRGMQGETERFQEFILQQEYDVIVNFAAQQWATDLVLPLLQQIQKPKVFVPTGFSGLYWKEYAEYFKEMPKWLGQYDVNIFLSENYRDINFARENGILHNTIVIPNGAGADEFSTDSNVQIRRTLGIPEDDFLILHVGSHTGHKGHGAAMRIFHHASIKNATFLLVANTFPGRGGCPKSCKALSWLFSHMPQRYLDKKKIINTSLTRDETVAAYKSADLFLFPSNIECSPLVLFESMASKTPFLTTDVGNAKEIVAWSNGAGIVLPTIHTSTGFSKPKVYKAAKILGELWRDEKKRKEMSQNGYEQWKNRFTWEKITDNYEEIYFKLLRKKNGCC